jgi:hypothetical protein
LESRHRLGVPSFADSLACRLVELGVADLGLGEQPLIARWHSEPDALHEGVRLLVADEDPNATEFTAVDGVLACEVVATERRG